MTLKKHPNEGVCQHRLLIFVSWVLKLGKQRVKVCVILFTTLKSAFMRCNVQTDNKAKKTKNINVINASW